MPKPEVRPASPALSWDGAAPRSIHFGDVYFSAADGLAEARTVFLQGCGLPEAWRGRSRFVVGELGFGTGLNILALLDLWGRTRHPEARLHIFSVEAFPLARSDAARALSAWPELAGLATGLLSGWPTGRPGFHRIDFPAEEAVLDLWIGEAGDGLEAWSGAADAWFLDGFAPNRNPQMWRDEVFALVGARSAPGSRAATFTVAGAVRRGLQHAGFGVQKRPGFGAKLERLEAVWPGDPPPASRAPSKIAVIGAGIAGASLVRALRSLGADPTVFDAVGAGAGASGNPAALVTPRLDAGFGPPAELHAQAHARAVELYKTTPGAAIIAEGALQLETTDRDAARFDRIAAWPGFASGALQRLDAAQAGERLGEPCGRGGLWLRDALVVEPAALLDVWFAGIGAVRAKVSDLKRTDSGWVLLDVDGHELGLFDAVVVAGGAETSTLLGLVGGSPSLQPVRGQTSWTRDVAWTTPAAWGGYNIPLSGGGVLFGATHVRGDSGCDTRATDEARNLKLLAEARPALAADLADRALEGRARLRAATPDHLPLAGGVAAAPGVFVLSGLGGRGFTLAPLLAEQLAAVMLGAPSPLPRAIAAAVDPQRFAARRAASSLSRRTTGLPIR